ncbi:hypothetical protein [Phenylobacterium sp.]|uniref:hypothetical protein n=1 Tax=Phenylobacterium sp. TaxID=1871053 RepID=UPI0035AE2EB5
MARYWLYFKSSGGEIVRALPLDCQDDREAIAWVESRRDTTDRELWLRRRRVRFWPSSANEP